MRRKGTTPKGPDRMVYDRCHVAWRAGLISGWYYGKRSERDATIVWELEGVETSRDALHAELESRYETAGIASIVWGPSWVGFRSLVVTYADGSQLVQRWDGARVVIEEVAA